MTFERIWDRAPFTVDYLDGTGADLAISFASVGHDAGRTPSPEFVGTASGRGGAHPHRRALFFSDASRSWANHPGFAPAVLGALALVDMRAPVRRIVTLGLSMGAFSALAAARIVPVDVVLAFGPQWSVTSEQDQRWSRWTKALPPLIWPTAPLPPRGWTCLFHGAADDFAQAQGFPITAGVDHLLFPDLGHSDLMAHLKARGVLPGLLDAAFAKDRRRLLRIAASAGAVPRRRFSASSARA